MVKFSILRICSTDCCKINLYSQKTLKYGENKIQLYDLWEKNDNCWKVEKNNYPEKYVD